ncbi:hypothetical protein MPER_00346, partial [Moniliophthora perniciosa FA553]
KITGGLKGSNLRQEYRELELLDEITKRRYESSLPPSVYGNTRNSLIRSFRAYVGEDYVPPNVHKTIRWSKADPLQEVDVEEIGWEIVTNANLKANLSKSTNGKTVSKPPLQLHSEPTNTQLGVKRVLSESAPTQMLMKRNRVVSPLPLVQHPSALDGEMSPSAVRDEF